MPILRGHHSTLFAFLLAFCLLTGDFVQPSAALCKKCRGGKKNSAQHVAHDDEARDASGVGALPTERDATQVIQPMDRPKNEESSSEEDKEKPETVTTTPASARRRRRRENELRRQEEIGEYEAERQKTSVEIETARRPMNRLRRRRNVDSHIHHDEDDYCFLYGELSQKSEKPENVAIRRRRHVSGFGSSGEVVNANGHQYGEHSSHGDDHEDEGRMRDGAAEARAFERTRRAAVHFHAEKYSDRALDKSIFHGPRSAQSDEKDQFGNLVQIRSKRGIDHERIWRDARIGDMEEFPYNSNPYQLPDTISESDAKKTTVARRAAGGEETNDEAADPNYRLQYPPKLNVRKIFEEQINNDHSSSEAEKQTETKAPSKNLQNKEETDRKQRHQQAERGHENQHRVRRRVSYKEYSNQYRMRRDSSDQVGGDAATLPEGVRAKLQNDRTKWEARAAALQNDRNQSGKT